jgi:hypothetical protein
VHTSHTSTDLGLPGRPGPMIPRPSRFSAPTQTSRTSWPPLHAREDEGRPRRGASLGALRRRPGLPRPSHVVRLASLGRRAPPRSDGRREQCAYAPSRAPTSWGSSSVKVCEVGVAPSARYDPRCHGGLSAAHPAATSSRLVSSPLPPQCPPEARRWVASTHADSTTPTRSSASSWATSYSS